MSYLAVTKFEKYQHYKNRRPTWIKFYVALLDPKHPLNELPVSTRYLFDRLLLLAAEYNNAIPNDSELLANMLRMSSNDVREGLAELQEGRWIKETRTKRRASKDAPETHRICTARVRVRGKELTGPRDLVWDALVEQLGEPQTKSERGRFNRAVKELKEIEAEPEEVGRRCALYRTRWPNVTLTPQALTANWTILEPKLAEVVPVEHVVDLPNVSEEERAQNLERLQGIVSTMGRSI